jgi:hypothetical protein
MCSYIYLLSRYYSSRALFPPWTFSQLGETHDSKVVSITRIDLWH